MNENEEEKPTKKAEQPESNSGKKEAKAKKIKLEDVRGILAEKSQAGMIAGVREIIKKYGALLYSKELLAMFFSKVINRHYDIYY